MHDDAPVDNVPVDDAPVEDAPVQDAPSEIVRASPALAAVAESLIHALFPGSALFRAEGAVVRLLISPPPTRESLGRLREMLFDLVERPEWRAKHALAREVSDDDGLRLELLVPISTRDYDGGPALVGPFADERSATEWGEDNARADVSFDTFFTGSAWLCDLFVLPSGGATAGATGNGR